MRRFILCCLALACLGGTPGNCLAASPTPEAALQALAKSIRDKDAKAFSAIVDVGALFDASFARGYEGGDTAGFVPFRQQEINNFLEGISSGRYAKICAETRRTGCPWYPDGLDKAKIELPDSSSALVSIDNKEDIRTWLVLHKRPEGWMVVADPERLQYAERYATAAFQKQLADYRETVRRQFEREAEQQAAYEKGVAEAAHKAAKILRTVTVDDIAFSLGTGSNENYLTISVRVTNGYKEPLRLWAVRMEFLDSGGQVLETRRYQDVTGFVEPGESIRHAFSTSLREPEMEIARNLVSGKYTARAWCDQLSIGRRNLMVDETGGGLKPAR